MRAEMNELTKAEKLEKIQFTILMIGLISSVLGAYQLYLQIQRMKSE
jgi:hypothetical protein